MNYTAQITLQDPDSVVAKAFSAEDKDFNGRASYTVEHKQGRTIFNITSQDSVTLRAACNAITKLLTVHENITKVHHGES
jgi:tRNA threonylcarbamoyladenosine modification (KEOPS) complex  Pcc1 subunit